MNTVFRIMDWILDTLFNSITGMLIAVAVFLALVAAIVDYSNNRWEEFVAAHDCKVVAQTAATTSYGITASGKFGTMVNSATTTWRCNDGVDYTR